MDILLAYHCEVNQQVQISAKIVHQKIQVSLQLACHLRAKIHTGLLGDMKDIIP